jgi:hypothetical protein
VQLVLLLAGPPAAAAMQWAAAIVAGLAVFGAAWLASSDLRSALAR